MPAAIDTCLRVADELDFQVQLHTDTLNESGFVEDTLAAIGGRTIHMYHTEGAGGGHAPDIIRVAGERQLPAVVDQSDQSLHRQHLRRAPRHDDGVPSPQSGDSRGRGLCREPHPRADHRGRGRAARYRRDLHARLRQPGHGPHPRGDLPDLAARLEDEGATRSAAGGADQASATTSASSATSPNTPSTPRAPSASPITSARSKPARSPTSCVWRPAFFGIKPELVIKGGFIAWGAMGDSAASLMTCEPILMRPQWGAFGRAPAALSACFVHPLAIERDLAGTPGPVQDAAAGEGHAQAVESATCCWNDACPNIRVDPADLRRLRRRRAGDLRAGEGAAAGATIHAEVTRC